MTNKKDKLAEAIGKLLSNKKNAIWVRLDKIIEEKIITGTQFVYHLYTIKRDINGTYMVEELIDYIINRLVDYVIPKKDIDAARKRDDEENTSSNVIRLFRQARELFNKLPQTGEPGELLLYILTVDILRLPLLLNKMSLKTSPGVHYHGADGVHVGYDSNSQSLSLYWCEAKMYKKFSKALKDCLNGVQTLLPGTGTLGEKKSTDLNLVMTNLDKNITDPKEIELLAEFFDKDHPNSNRLKHSAICFIGFDADHYFKSEEVGHGELEKSIVSWDKCLTSELKKRPLLENRHMHIFLMPMKSVDDFRKKFLEKI